MNNRGGEKSPDKSTLKKEGAKNIFADDSKNPFEKLFLPSEISTLFGVWDRWVEDTPTREKMLWLVEHTEVCIPSIESEIPRFLSFVDKSSEEMKKDRDLFIWLKEWILSAKKDKRIDFYKMADGHWLPDGEHSLTDGTALIVSGGFNFRERVERALTKEKYRKFLDDQMASARAGWTPDPEDEEEFNQKNA